MPYRAFVLLLIGITAPAICGASELNRPSGVLDTLRDGHPRLLISAKDIDVIQKRRQTDSTVSAWYARIRREADKLLTAPVSKYEIPDGKRLLRVSRRVLL